jgi:hypothetical protein
MTDEESLVPPVRPSSEDGELLLYDFFKHLTSLALLTLGGVLVLAKEANRADVKTEMIVIVLVLISASGIAAFSGAGEIVRARYTRSEPFPTLKYYRMAAPALLAIGVGMFLTLYADSLT